MRTKRTCIPIVLAALLSVACTGAATPAATASSTPSTQAPSQAVSWPVPANATASAQVSLRATSSPQATDQPRAVGYPTPEEAVRQYLAAVAQTNVDGILQASAIDETGEGFHFDLFVDRLKAMMLTQSLSPAEYPFYAEINKAQQTARILGQVRALTYSLLSTEPIEGQTIAPADKARADAFAKSVNPARLSDLKVIDIRFSSAPFEKNERYLANMAALAKVYGADEMTERVALMEFEGKYYYVRFQLLRHGGYWKVSDRVANLAPASPYGAAKPTTPEDFDRMTNGD